MLDSPIRWNSIVPMIERYLLLKSCIKKALIDLNSQINLNENEIEMMQELLNILKPVQMAVEGLSARYCNLVTAEGVMQFLFNSIGVLPGTLSKNVLEALQKRLLERLSKDLISLAMFLQNPENFKSNTNEFSKGNVFALSSDLAVSKLAKTILIRYFSDDRDIIIDSTLDLGDTIDVPTTNANDSILLSSSTTNDLLKKSLESAIINSQKTMEIAKPDKTKGRLNYFQKQVQSLI